MKPARGALRRGELAILAGIAAIVAVAALRSVGSATGPHAREVPFYSTADAATAQHASDLIRREGCRSCHSLWSTRDPMQAVPAPMLDGMGDLRSRQWLFDYLSARQPQQVLPSRLKAEYRMPSYAALPEAERALLADYLASLRVRDWYLDQTRRLEHDKLTGERTAEAPGSDENPKP